MMDLDFFIRMYKDKTIKTKYIDVCVITFRTGGASSTPAKQLEEERRRLVLENGGNMVDATIYIWYHRIKYMIKICRNKVKQWIKK